MSQSFECSWCGSKMQIVEYPIVQAYLLFFEKGTTLDIFGPSIVRYKIEDICTPCVWKLKKELIKLGIKLQEIDYEPKL